MPMTRIFMKAGRSGEFKKKLMHELYLAMHESFDVPADDYFMSITEHDDETFYVSKDYMNIERSDDMVMIEITAKHGRTSEQKKELFKLISQRLSKNLEMREEDIFITIVENKAENWSMGMGRAQYARGDFGLLRDATMANGTSNQSRPGRLSLWL